MGHTTANWLRLESLFDRAVVLPPAQREDFISEQCRDDDQLGFRLRRMLSSDGGGGLLDAAAMSRLHERDVGTSLVNRRLGDFLVLHVIAAGGMGTVYEAQQEHPPRRVALKVLSTALLSPDARRRFEFEAETLARLNHPAIATIFESGVFVADDSPHGRPYFAMELVRGLPCTHFADSHRLGLHDRVRMLIRVCEGVEHAHSRGVIHCDIKPANILVEDGLERAAPPAPRPRILDFGIARAIDPQRQNTRQAGEGQILGTLAYMSPEQVAGDVRHIDQRSDVYAMGVLAYELLGRRVPHDVSSTSMAEALRVIAEHDPPPLGALDRRCRGDLEIIVARALEKDPDRRYQSAAALAEDLRRFLAHEPIAARRSSRVYQIRKFARRNRGLVAGVAGVVVTLAAGVIATAWQWVRAADQRDHARYAEAQAQHNLREANAAIGFMHEFAEQELSNIAGAAAARLTLARQALARQQTLPADSPAEHVALSYAHQRVGDVLLTLGRSSEALDTYRASLALRRKAVHMDNVDVLARDADRTHIRALAVGHFKMFDALHRMGRDIESEDHARQSLECLELYSSVLLDPISPIEDRYFSFARRRLGDALLAQGRIHEAVGEFMTSLRHADAVTQPDVVPDRQGSRGHIMALRGWGDALALLGHWREALAQHRASLAVVERQSTIEGPANVWERSMQSRVLADMARDLLALDDVAAAVRHARMAVDVAAPLAAADCENIESQYVLAHAQLALAEAYARHEDHEQADGTARQAVSALERIVTVDPLYAAAGRDLADARLLLKRQASLER